MQNVRLSVLFSVVLILCGCAQTAKPTRQYSFSCSRAKNQAERIICSSEELRALDAKMTSRYQRAIAQTPNTEQRSLRDDQRYWIAEVRNTCETKKCLYRTYENRIEDLQLWAKNDDLDRRSSRSRLKRPYEDYSSADDSYGYDDGWDGRWTRSNWNSDNTGMLRIKQINSRRLSFRLSASSERGRGEIMGEAPIEGNYAVYKDRSEGCELEMYLKDDSIEVSSSRGCDRYGDGRVDFEGRYRRD